MNERTCIACFETTDASNFYRDKMSKDGLKARCKRCESSRRLNNLRAQRVRENELGVRTCKACKEIKPFSEYFQTAHQDPSGIPRYRSICKICHQSATNQWRENHAEELRLRRLASRDKRNRKVKLIKYGLTEEQLTAMELEADGACCICRRNVPNLVVDHSHRTGKARALLCPTCNQGLGLFRDDPQALKQAAEYLLGHSE